MHIFSQLVICKFLHIMFMSLSAKVVSLANQTNAGNMQIKKRNIQRYLIMQGGGWHTSDSKLLLFQAQKNY